MSVIHISLYTDVLIMCGHALWQGEEVAVKHTSSVSVCVRHPAWQTFCACPLKSSASQVLCWQLLG